MDKILPITNLKNDKNEANTSSKQIDLNPYIEYKSKDKGSSIKGRGIGMVELVEAQAKRDYSLQVIKMRFRLISLILILLFCYFTNTMPIESIISLLKK